MQRIKVVIIRQTDKKLLKTIKGINLRDKIKDLQNVCKIVSKLKSQLIEKLPHYSSDALFLKNDEITTGLLNNITEIKIKLITGDLLYFHNEHGYVVDLTREHIFEKLDDIVTNHRLKMPDFSFNIPEY